MLNSQHQQLYKIVVSPIFKRLERLYALATTEADKEAFFFVSSIAISDHGHHAGGIIDVFYKKVSVVKNFFLELSQLATDSHGKKIFILLMQENKVDQQEIEAFIHDTALQNALRHQLAQDAKHFLEQRAPEQFYKMKYLLLCTKYRDLLVCP